MSQEIPKDLSLRELVRNSCFILVVERSEPFNKVEMISMDSDEKKCPPFRKDSYRFKVIEVLLNRIKTALEPEIEVKPALTSVNLRLHQDLYLRGVRRSSFWPVYGTTADFNSKKLIIFLNSAFEFTAHGAYESIDNKERVLESIAGINNSV